MVKKICSVYDSKAEAWLPPMFFQAVGQAYRSFEDVVNAPEGEFVKHPEDYTLFLLGEWNEREGVITVLDAPVAVARGVDVIRGLEVVADAG